MSDTPFERYLLVLPVLANVLSVQHKGCEIRLNGREALSRITAPDRNAYMVAVDDLELALKEIALNVRLVAMGGTEIPEPTDDAKEVRNWTAWALRRIPLRDLPYILLSERQVDAFLKDLASIGSF